jgi:ADP-ribose pyrophosphatase YjhB (NUDIX family)
MAEVIGCVGAVAREGDALLLVLRGRPPGEGHWSIPGGRVEDGEDDTAALIREMAEETGLIVTIGPHLGTVMRDAPGGGIYEIRDYAVAVVGGSLRAGDDAADVRWVPEAELPSYLLVDGLLESLRAWGSLASVPDE